MAQIKILDKEKDYLLSVSPYQFVDSLSSASIFYELLSYDLLDAKTDVNDNTKRYNNITLVGVYNALLNLIAYEAYEGLVLRHNTIYKKPTDNAIKLLNLVIRVCSVNYMDEYIQLLTDNTADIYQEFEYIVSSSIPHGITISDKINFSTRTYSMFEHTISIDKKDISGDFVPKLLILYQDFADNIPI